MAVLKGYNDSTNERRHSCICVQPPKSVLYAFHYHISGQGDLHLEADRHSLPV